MQGEPKLMFGSTAPSAMFAVELVDELWGILCILVLRVGRGCLQSVWEGPFFFFFSSGLSSVLGVAFVVLELRDYLMHYIAEIGAEKSRRRLGEGQARLLGWCGPTSLPTPSSIFSPPSLLLGVLNSMLYGTGHQYRFAENQQLGAFCIGLHLKTSSSDFRYGAHEQCQVLLRKSIRRPLGVTVKEAVILCLLPYRCLLYGPEGHENPQILNCPKTFLDPSSVLIASWPDLFLEHVLEGDYPQMRKDGLSVIRTVGQSGLS